MYVTVLVYMQLKPQGGHEITSSISVFRDENLGLKGASVGKPSVTFDEGGAPTEEEDIVPTEQETEMEVESSEPPPPLGEAPHPMTIPIDSEVS